VTLVRESMDCIGVDEAAEASPAAAMMVVLDGGGGWRKIGGAEGPRS
jgi:hypothetical protein